ncbi:MAG: DUF1385 domain-containing protein [Lachnospiraceae bacterium]|nr:DUF1385 domain-containing protein [Lachnospiraceae bacterium]
MAEGVKKGYSGIGGQAVLEGVMMKNGEKYAVAVRKPDGNITVEVEHYAGILHGSPVKKIPFIRGVFNFIDSMILGMRAINYSASFYDDESEKEARRDSKKVKNDSKKNGSSIVVTVISLIIAVGLFAVLPAYLAGLFDKFVRNDSLVAIIEGVIRILIFLGYIIFISALKDIRRLYGYHGAEHKCIDCIEKGRILTVKNVTRSSRFHKRCGTSFLYLVVFISVVLFIFIRVDTLWLRLLVRVLMIPVIAGISYEVLSLAGKYDNIFITIISAPGIWIQHLTTREPDKHMIQVAIASVEAVFDWKAYLKDVYDYEVTDEMMGEDEEEDHIKLKYNFLKEEKDEFVSLQNPDDAILEEDDFEDGPELDEPDEDDWEDDSDNS